MSSGFLQFHGISLTSLKILPPPEACSGGGLSFVRFISLSLFHDEQQLAALDGAADFHQHFLESKGTVVRRFGA